MRVTWKEPKLHELDAPKEYLELINAGIFYNRTGNFEHADNSEIIQYLLAILLGWLSFSVFLLLVLIQISSFFTISAVQITISLTGLLALLGLFYWWGWLKYEQAWYHFNDSDEMFTVIRKTEGEWELIEIPYEQVEKVEWSGSDNGYATIYVPGFTFDTNRSSTKRYSSVTEMWNQLARLDTVMSNWPIIMKCEACNRTFGHHIGTATCPFDDILLLDPDNKGRIDPEDIHPDDIHRV